MRDRCCERHDGDCRNHPTPCCIACPDEPANWPNRIPKVMGIAWQDGIDAALRIVAEQMDGWVPGSGGYEALAVVRMKLHAERISGGVDQLLVDRQRGEVSDA